jgi:hypothetical protein
MNWKDVEGSSDSMSKENFKTSVRIAGLQADI